MHMMPFTRHVMAVAGLWLGLGLTGEFVHADDWYREHGMASYYGKGFHGRKAADGERFSQHEMTAAHRQLPLGTKVMVENPDTGEQVEVKITDRGPYGVLRTFGDGGTVPSAARHTPCQRRLGLFWCSSIEDLAFPPSHPRLCLTHRR